MKLSRIKSGLLLILISCCLANCSKEVTTGGLTNLNYTTFKHSLNGWELYSWPKGNDFNYSLLEGTSTVKSIAEVTSNYFIVHGADSLELLLDRLPENEIIKWFSQTWLSNNWGTDYGNLTLPSGEMVSKIQQYCDERPLVLTILQ